MGLTLSHTSALSALRMLRADEVDVRCVDHGSIATPQTWVGKRWSMREFISDEWKWDRPSSKQPLHVMVANQQRRVRMQYINSHVCATQLPASSILWLDEHTTISSPVLLFIQMAEIFSVPELVLLGYELCGDFARSATNPFDGPVTDGITQATSVDELRHYMDSVDYVPGLVKARIAVQYVADHAVSAPEAVLATMYSLPPEESGYGMGPVSLNQRVDVSLDESTEDGQIGNARSRYPDILFSFAPLGINYDGEDHLDLRTLVRLAIQAVLSSDVDTEELTRNLLAKQEAIRAKYVDDIRRNRQLASKGRIVFPVTKEDLYEHNGLDNLTRQILSCAQEAFGIDIRKYVKVLDNTQMSRDRRALLASMLPSGRHQARTDRFSGYSKQK